ncbi:MAG: alpha/beta fold hydrolase [Holophaga sp.]|nr:alpha/beta fold hydrolase [Holophaga sp.]
MTPCPRHILTWIAGLLIAAQTLAAQVGWTQISVSGSAPDAGMTTVALYYPTQARASAVTMGPLVLNVALQAPPDPTVKALIMLSHGQGGSEISYSRLAEALARQGYLVAALRHPGDNWKDQSLLEKTPELYFNVRPRQVSHVLDALLLDPKWKDRIARDARGPRVGALGHSAGGYTVLALAGGAPDLARLARHCGEEGAEDPIFCSLRKGSRLPDPAPAPALRDGRVRAVVAMAPVGAVFTPESLAAIRIPTVIYAPQLDRFLVPRFHSEWIARNMPGAELRRVPNAGHFAFLDTPTMAISSPDGDLGDNPPGFDRAAFLTRLGGELGAFFDQAFQKE